MENVVNWEPILAVAIICVGMMVFVLISARLTRPHKHVEMHALDLIEGGISDEWPAEEAEVTRVVYTHAGIQKIGRLIETRDRRVIIEVSDSKGGRRIVHRKEHEVEFVQ